MKEELTQKRRLYSETSKSFRANNITLPEVTLGTALLPLQSTQVLNKSLLLHTGNLVKPAKLQSVALRDLSNEADSILGMTQELDAIPVLLAPDEASISKAGKAMQRCMERSAASKMPSVDTFKHWLQSPTRKSTFPPFGRTVISVEHCKL